MKKIHGKKIRRLNFGSPQLYVEDETPQSIIQIYRRLASEGVRIDKSRAIHIHDRIKSEQCKFCGEMLKLVYERSYECGIGVFEYIYQCDQCGNWKANSCTTMTPTEHILPFISNFNPHRHTASLTHLINETKKNPKILFSTNPKQFELFVGSVLGEFMQCEVFHVGKTNDGGIDLIAVAAESPLLIQVKRRLDSESVEAIDTVKLLFASMFAAGAQKGAIVTTAQRFSKHAKDWIHLPQLRDFKYEIDLVDFDRLIAMVKNIPSNESGPDLALQHWKQQPAYEAYLLVGTPWMYHNTIVETGLEGDDLSDRVHISYQTILDSSEYDKAMTETSSGVRKSMKNHVLERTSHIARCEEGFLVKIDSSAGDICVYIKENDAERGWKVSLNQFEIAKTINTHDYKPENLNVEASEADFSRAIQSLPPAVIDLMIASWAATRKGENWITW